MRAFLSTTKKKNVEHEQHATNAHGRINNFFSLQLWLCWYCVKCVFVWDIPKRNMKIYGGGGCCCYFLRLSSSSSSFYIVYYNSVIVPVRVITPWIDILLLNFGVATFAFNEHTNSSSISNEPQHNSLLSIWFLFLGHWTINLFCL